MRTSGCLTQLFQLLYMNFEKGLVLACCETSNKYYNSALMRLLFLRLLSIVPICTALVGVGDRFVKWKAYRKNSVNAEFSTFIDHDSIAYCKAESLDINSGINSSIYLRRPEWDGGGKWSVGFVIFSTANVYVWLSYKEIIQVLVVWFFPQFLNYGKIYIT